MTEITLTLLALAGPAALVLTALQARIQPGRAPLRLLAVARVACIVAVLGAGAAVARVALYGPTTTPLFGIDGLGFAVRLDALSVTMLALVAFMGGVVLRFSRAYLDGDERHGAFVGNLALTVSSVMLLVLAGNLVHLVAFWALTSFALHRLLLFYPERRGAVAAARKKFIVARAGDVLLAVAAVLLWVTWGTADITELAAAVAANGAVGPATTLAAFAVVASAALKSAMIPTHGWLLDVMETPTPVSALLHAGIINGGTFLVVRLAEVVVHVPAALHTAVVIGATTAVLASIVLTTQPAIKTALAWSSAAHMGFMLMLCGFGAFPVAILHLVAHSFYKAHAFLSSGSAAEVVRASAAGKATTPSRTQVGLGLVASALTVAGVGALFGVQLTGEPVTFGLAAVIVVALGQLWTGGLALRGSGTLVLGRIVIWATATATAFFGLELSAARLLSGAVPTEPVSDPVSLALLALVVAAFAVVVTLQLRLEAIRTRPLFRRLWVHTRHGFYLNTLFDRLVGAWAPRRDFPAAPLRRTS